MGNNKKIKLVDGLTIEEINTNYSWLAEAETENLIVGKNENGIVIYGGHWINGNYGTK